MNKLRLDSELKINYPNLVINKTDHSFWSMCKIDYRTCQCTDTFILRGKLDGSNPDSLEIFTIEGTSCATCPRGR